MADFMSEAERERLDTKLLQSDRVSILRAEGPEVTYSEGLGAAHDCIEAAEERGARRIIVEVSVIE